MAQATGHTYIACLGGDIHGYLVQMPDEWIERGAGLVSIANSKVQWRLATLTLQVDGAPDDSRAVLVPVDENVATALQRLMRPTDWRTM